MMSFHTVILDACNKEAQLHYLILQTNNRPLSGVGCQAEVKAKFDEADVDGSGHLDANELAVLVTAPPTPEHAHTNGC